MTEFDDMTKRILDKLDITDVKIDDLCGRMMKMEIELKSHFDDIEKKQAGKDRKFYIIIGAMATAFTSFELLQNII
ncbi:MAG: hypothetical protein H8D92_02155 [Pelagibacteraceae bacterium]|nr:hypothetical protein [Pelagibacteraceae bacterium]